MVSGLMVSIIASTTQETDHPSTMKSNLLFGIAASALPYAIADLCFSGYQTSDCSGLPVVVGCADSLPVGSCESFGNKGPFRYIEASGDSNKYLIQLYSGSCNCFNGSPPPSFTGTLKQPTGGCADTRQNWDSFKRIV